MLCKVPEGLVVTQRKTLAVLEVGIFIFQRSRPSLALPLQESDTIRARPPASGRSPHLQGAWPWLEASTCFAEQLLLIAAVPPVASRCH